MAPSKGSILKFVLFISLAAALAIVLNDDLATHIAYDQKSSDYVNLSRDFGDLQSNYTDVANERDVFKFRLENYPCDTTRDVRDSASGAYEETKQSAVEKVNQTGKSINEAKESLQNVAKPITERIYYVGKLTGWW